MRLSDAGLRQRQTKALYPNNRRSPWLTEDATRDRSNRLLDACDSAPRAQTHSILGVTCVASPNSRAEADCSKQSNRDADSEQYRRERRAHTEQI
jgi:hypothetical protein